MSERAGWHQRGERGSLLGMRFIAFFYRWVGWQVAHFFVYPVVVYFFTTDRSGRRASLEYLRRVRAADAASLDREPTMRDVFRHYMEFGTTILDRIGFWLARRDDFDFSIKGAEELEWVVEQRCAVSNRGEHQRRRCLSLGARGWWATQSFFEDTAKPISVSGGDAGEWVGGLGNPDF